MPYFLKKLLVSLLNIAMPGMGFALLGFYHYAVLTQTVLLLITTLLCWSRGIFLPSGVWLLLLMMITVPLVSTGFLAAQYYRQRPGWQVKHGVVGVVFAAVSAALFYGGFITKHQWLGVHINFVPSPSMQPTLEPGDFILVDTWRYRYHAPAINDVVTFTSSQHEGLLVKRIQPWPGTDAIEQHGGYFVMGDNRPYSTDSRRFGGISREQIQGQVRLVLFSLDRDLSPRPHRWLRSVE